MWVQVNLRERTHERQQAEGNIPVHVEARVTRKMCIWNMKNIWEGQGLFTVHEM